MTDRELLELAAKAAGVETWVDDYENHWIGGNMRIWNPLNDDGDALRLAAELRLSIKPGKHLGDVCSVYTQREGIAGCTAFHDDKYRQMRRAIVIAAAEIGKTK